MTMYNIIADEYDNLFPHPQAKTDFVETRLTNKNEKILDMGCATGELLLSLIAKGTKERQLIGIDLDGTMVDIAKEKALAQQTPNTEFKLYDMRYYLEYIDIHSMDMLLCFGNTLAYLKDPKELNDFFKNAYRVLQPGGGFIIQILNFDNPAMGIGFTFPELNTSKLKFSRSYAEDPTGGILFNIEVFQKDIEVTMNDTHRLYPFTSSQIMTASKKAQFSSCLMFGGYNDEEIKTDDFSRLYVLTK